MKRKRLVSLLVALVLLLGAVPTGQAASPYVYVALGDSIAAGYGLPSAAQSYPARLAGLIGATKSHNLAQSGMTSAQVLALLSDPAAAAAIKGANLVTVSAGGADVLGAMLGIIREAGGTDDIAVILADPAKLAAVAAALRSEETRRTIYAVLSGLSEVLPQIASGIKELNPSATIVFTNAYNPYAGFAVTGLELGAYTDALVKEHNAMMAHVLSGEKIADVYTRFGLPGTPSCVNASLKPPVNFDPHPNAVGHGAIADLIYKKVSKQFPAIKYPARAAVAGQKLSVYRSVGAGKFDAIAAGAAVIVYKWNDTWAKIGWNRGYAYVKVAGLKLNALLDVPAKRVQLMAKAAVYETASTRATRISVQPKGSQFVLYSVTGKWAKVQIDSQFGYIETRCLTKV